MFLALLILICIRPFICSPVFQAINLTYLVILLIVIFCWLYYKGISIQNRSAMPFFLLLIVILLLSVVISSDKILAMEKLLQYVDGIALILICQSLSNEDQEKTIGCLIGTGLIVSLLALYQYAVIFPKLINSPTIAPQILDYINQKRINYPLFTPNTLGGYLIMIVPIVFTWKNCSLLALPLLTALLFTQSIGALLSLFLAIFIYYFALKQLRKKELLLLTGIAAVIVLVFILRSHTPNETFQPFFSFNMRLNYWQDTLLVIRTYPWTGIGLGNFDLYHARYSHNAYLQIWAEIGIVGLAAFLYIIIDALKNGLKIAADNTARINRAGLICASLTFLIHNFMDFTFFLPEVSLIWCVILGLASNRSSPQKTQNPLSPGVSHSKG